ncbi:LytTR family DNA-binding domain-containing protein [Lacrimispora xylanisolvens]|uniref:LytTR family DNA-binding domain-containing protein n=1 Tax=Lacrimispora xylanisolvens TaxID=384636 RepID=UPI002402BD2C
MKIQIEIDTALQESELRIRCPEINEEITQIQKMISKLDNSQTQMVFYQNDTEFYFHVSRVLFFETADKGIFAHTTDDEFLVEYKLYELEELLPPYFMRISKSTILNTTKVYSITRSPTASSRVEFQNSYKKVYVSRNYYKILKWKLDHQHMER